MKTSALLVATSSLIVAAMLGQSGDMRAAPPPSAAPAEPLDLTGFYRWPASTFDASPYPWGVAPRGTKKLGNIPLDIGDTLVLWGEANTEKGMVFPETVEDIPVKRKFDTLYVYHATFFTSRGGVPVYHVVTHYADDTSSLTTICYGAHVRDWIQQPDEPVSELTDSKSKLVWRGDNPKSPPNRPQKVRFFITPLPNPRPDLEVKSISLVSAKGHSAGVICAMTTGPADLLKVDKSVDK